MSKFIPLPCRSDYGAFWKCIQTGFIYACTQLCKMMVLATFFPIPSSGHESLGGGTAAEPNFLDGGKDRIASVSGTGSDRINPKL